MIIYTSGTTGFAKGALLHHLGVVNAAGLSARQAGFADGDCWAGLGGPAIIMGQQPPETKPSDP